MKKFLSLLLAMLMVLSMAACGTTTAPAETAAPTEAATEAVTEAATEAATEATEASAYPMTVVDMAGREVTIEAEPQKIVSGYYISSSACIALGLSDRMVAVEDKADKRPIYKLAAPAMAELPMVGTAKEFNLEACLAAEPDLVILPMKQKDTAATLAEMGIPALLVLPESHEQILEMFTLIGTACNVEENTTALCTYYSDVLAKIEGLTASIAEEDKAVAYICATSSYLRTAPGQMYQASLLASAGAIDAAHDIEGNSWVDISYEQLLAMNPDVIIVPTNNFATSTPDFTVEDVLADAQLSEVTAVANGAVYMMPTGFEAWDSPCPSGVLGMLWMLKTLHPELYTAEEFAADVTEFYETFYGFTPDTTALN